MHYNVAAVCVKQNYYAETILWNTENGETPKTTPSFWNIIVQSSLKCSLNKSLRVS